MLLYWWITWSSVLVNTQQVEDAASKVQAAGKASGGEQEGDISDEDDDDDDVSSMVRTSLEMEYVTAIDSLGTAVDEFCTFKSTLESEYLLISPNSINNVIV